MAEDWGVKTTASSYENQNLNNRKREWYTEKIKFLRMNRQYNTYGSVLRIGKSKLHI